MANLNNKTQEELQQQKINESVSKTEQFLNENKKTILSCLGAAAIIALAALCYSNFYLTPKKAEAAREMYAAEALFQSQNYAEALQGDGNNLGFADIISEYGSKAGTAVYFYAGVCELQEGNYEEAVKYLNKYKGSEPILKARALANIGDAYCGLEDYAKAVTYFEKAASTADNMFAAAYLLKAGICYEELEKPAKALECYEAIRETYPQSIEGSEIDKYIERISK